MAITVDQTSLGIATNDATATTIVLTTSAAVASGGFIVLLAGGFDNADVSSVSGGGLTWTVDKTAQGTSKSIGICSAQAPSGLASSTAITVTYSATVSARFVGAASFLGVATSSPVDGTPLGPTDNNPSTTWTTGNYAIAAGSVIVGGCLSDAFASHTATAGIELFEANDVADAYGGVAVYRVEASAGSYAVGGTFSGSGFTKNIAVAYLAAADEPPAGDITRSRLIHSRMTSW